jgi:hypothetical protein
MNLAPLVPAQYIANNVVAARRFLDEARSILGERPSIQAPPDVISRAVAAARNAAEHLYDTEQVDEHGEAVREALAAAASIMNVVESLERTRPGIAPNRDAARNQLMIVDETLSRLERDLGLTESTTS